MNYNLLFKTSMGGFNLMKLSSNKLHIILDYYEYGKETFTLAGQKYHAKGLQALKIYTDDKEVDLKKFKAYCKQDLILERNLMDYYFGEAALQLLGLDKTEQFIGDHPYGYKKQTDNISNNAKHFVNPKRIEELKNLPTTKFDFSKLIRLCEELNNAYRSESYLSVGMIGRTILHHIPPLFGLKNFDEVASNYGGPKDHRSFKGSMAHLAVSLKNIADGLLHTQIRKKETLPFDTQVDFRQDLDNLLGEIVRVSN